MTGAPPQTSSDWLTSKSNGNKRVPVSLDRIWSWGWEIWWYNIDDNVTRSYNFAPNHDMMSFFSLFRPCLMVAFGMDLYLPRSFPPCIRCYTHTPLWCRCRDHRSGRRCTGCWGRHTRCLSSHCSTNSAPWSTDHSHCTTLGTQLEQGSKGKVTCLRR